MWKKKGSRATIARPFRSLSRRGGHDLVVEVALQVEEREACGSQSANGRPIPIRPKPPFSSPATMYLASPPSALNSLASGLNTLPFVASLSLCSTMYALILVRTCCSAIGTEGSCARNSARIALIWTGGFSRLGAGRPSSPTAGCLLRLPMCLISFWCFLSASLIATSVSLSSLARCLMRPSKEVTTPSRSAAAVVVAAAASGSWFVAGTTSATSAAGGAEGAAAGAGAATVTVLGAMAASGVGWSYKPLSRIYLRFIRSAIARSTGDGTLRRP